MSLPERLSISIALILSQLILVVGEEQSMPTSSDLKLLDLYLMVNFLVNSAALIECLFASFHAKRAEAVSFFRVYILIIIDANSASRFQFKLI